MPCKMAVLAEKLAKHFHVERWWRCSWRSIIKLNHWLAAKWSIGRIFAALTAKIYELRSCLMRDLPKKSFQGSKIKPTICYAKDKYHSTYLKSIIPSDFHGSQINTPGGGQNLPRVSAARPQPLAWRDFFLALRIFRQSSENASFYHWFSGDLAVFRARRRLGQFSRSRGRFRELLGRSNGRFEGGEQCAFREIVFGTA